MFVRFRVIERIVEHLGRDAAPVDAAHPSRAPPQGDLSLSGGQRYEIMADTIPGRPSKCPPCGRNTVRHAVETVSAIGSESCPPWPGTRTRGVRIENSAAKG